MKNMMMILLLAQISKGLSQLAKCSEIKHSPLVSIWLRVSALVLIF